MPEFDFEKWFLVKIMEERKRQIEKFGEQNHPTPVWTSIVTEEIGEAAREANDYYLAVIAGNDTQSSNAEVLARLANELIETAAVSLNALQSIFKNEINVLEPKYLEKCIDLINGKNNV